MALPPVVVKVVAGGVPEVTKSLKTISDTVEKLEKKSIQVQEQAANARVRSARKEGAEKVRAAKGAATEEERLAKHITAVKERSALMAGRFYAKQAADEIRLEQQKTRVIERELAKQSAARRRQQASFANGVGGRLKSDASSLYGGAKSLLVGAATIGGGFALADALRYNLKAQSAATNLEIASGGAVTKEQAMGASRKTSLRLGIEQADVVKGMQAFVARTGNGKEGLALVDFMADVAKSQDVDIGEIGKAMGQARVQNKSATTEELKQLMLSAVAQGKAGSVEIGDMAGALVKATASKSMYAGNSVENMKKLAGLAQIAMVGSSDADMAGTAVAHIGTDITREKKHWDALGIKTTDASGKFLNDPVELLKEMVIKTGGSVMAQHKLLGERSKYVAYGMNDVYNEAEKNQKGSGKAALDKYVDDIMKQQMSTAELQADLLKKMKDPAEAIARAFNTLKMQLGDKLSPHIDRLIAKLPQIVEGIMKLVDRIEKIVVWATDNPFQAVVLAITASLVKAIGAEVVSQAVAGAVARVIAGNAATGGAAGGVGVGGGLATAGAAALAAGTWYAVAKGMDSLNKTMDDSAYDPSRIIKQAAEGDKNAKTWVAMTRDEGTGFGGDVTRALKGVGAISGILGGTITDALGFTKGEADAWSRNYANIGVRSGIAYQLADGNTPERASTQAFLAGEIRRPKDNTGESAHVTSSDLLTAEILKAEMDQASEARKRALEQQYKEQIEAAKLAGIAFGEKAADAVRENLAKNPLPTNGQPSDPGGGR